MANINTYFVAQGDPGIEKFVGGFVLYIYLAYTTMVLARRLGTKHIWMAWIPVANLYLVTQMAGVEWWWMLGFFIPFVNFLVAGYLWSEIGKRLGKPWWIGILTAIPVLGLLIPGYFVITSGSVRPRKPITLPL